MLLTPALPAAAARIWMTLLPAALLMGCKKESPEPTLPAATQTGQNTAGCRVDGKTWIAFQSDPFAGPAKRASWLKLEQSGRFALSILLNKSDDYNEVHSQTSISLYVPDLRQPGTVVFNQVADPSLFNSNPAYGRFIFGNPSPGRVYLTGPAATGVLVITRFDTVARVVAGTYEFQALAQTGGVAPVRVTEGRFDLTF